MKTITEKWKNQRKCGLVCQKFHYLRTSCNRVWWGSRTCMCLSFFECFSYFSPDTVAWWQIQKIHCWGGGGGGEYRRDWHTSVVAMKSLTLLAIVQGKPCGRDFSSCPYAVCSLSVYIVTVILSIKCCPTSNAGIILGCEIERFSHTFQWNLIKFDTSREYFLWILLNSLIKLIKYERFSHWLSRPE